MSLSPGSSRVSTLDPSGLVLVPLQNRAAGFASQSSSVSTHDAPLGLTPVSERALPDLLQPALPSGVGLRRRGAEQFACFSLVVGNREHTTVLLFGPDLSSYRINSRGNVIGLCDLYRVRAPTSSQQRLELQLQRLGSYEWSNERAKLLSSPSHIRICCDIPQGISSPIKARIPDPLRII